MMGKAREKEEEELNKILHNQPVGENPVAILMFVKFCSIHIAYVHSAI